MKRGVHSCWVYMLLRQHRSSGGKGVVCKMLTWREYYHGVGGEMVLSRGAASGGFKVSAGAPVIGQAAPDPCADWWVQT